MGFNDWHRSVFDTVCILHIYEKWILVSGSIRSLVLLIDIHSLVLLPE